ncbi:MAG TPA: hypothetical protein VEB61_07065 [Candidatus Binatia bacterium]|nr:hypothetical protein [Candidatus Binatia bacterium]
MTFNPSQVVTRHKDDLTSVRGYERLLRVVGQAMEKNNFHSFELTPVGENFHVWGSTQSASKENIADRTAWGIRSLWDRLPNRNGSDGPAMQASETVANGRAELLLTLREIQRLDTEGQAQRVDPTRMVNTSSLPQVLRCLGAYLSQKRARLLKVTRQEEELLVEYETSLGSQRKESFNARAIYDIWVRMYLQRAGR